MPFSSSILTRSAVFEAVLRSAQLIAHSDASVLITGESGCDQESNLRRPFNKKIFAFTTLAALTNYTKQT